MQDPDERAQDSTMPLPAAAALCSGISGLAMMCQGIALDLVIRKPLEDHNADREACLIALRLAKVSAGLTALLDEPRSDEFVTRELRACVELVDELYGGLTQAVARRTGRRPLQDPLRARES